MKAAIHLHIVAAAAVVCCAVLAGGRPALAQLLYSFESASPPLDGWVSDGSGGGAFFPIVPSTTFGVTDGTTSMMLDNLTSGFKNDIGHVTNGAGSGDAFTAWNDAAIAMEGGRTGVKLEFDFSWDTTNVTGNAQFAQLGLFLNSTGANFTQYGTGDLIGGNVGTGAVDLFPRLDPNAVSDGVTLTTISPNTIHLAIPLGPASSAARLRIGSGPAGTNFYQMGFKSNGSWAGTMDWAIDNVRITGAQIPTTSETLFSWETPDNPGTPSVDESFEGWIEGGVGTNPPHEHTIVTTGATEGTHALQIDRTTTPSGFTWGSSYNLNSDVDPGPGQTIDPVIQAKIDTLINKINAADRVAFDVTYQYQDHFPIGNPSFTGFGVHFVDGTQRQYQAFGSNIGITPANTTPQTVKVEIPLDSFTDAANSANTLANSDLLAGSNIFRIAISTNTDGAQIYKIDNFRLVTEVSVGVPGDYNNNGTVDAADYVLWRNGGPIQNEVSGVTPGTVTVEDYDAWRARLGNTSGSGASNGAVPEPAVGVLVFSVIAGHLFSRRRHR